MSEPHNKNRIKYRFHIRVETDDLLPCGKYHRIECTSDGYTRTNAIFTLLRRLKDVGVSNIRRVNVLSEPIAAKDFKLPKPKQHKHNTYTRIYDGTKLKAYQHKETKVRITPAEYRALD